MCCIVGQDNSTFCNGVEFLLNFGNTYPEGDIFLRRRPRQVSHAAPQIQNAFEKSSGGVKRVLMRHKPGNCSFPDLLRCASRHYVKMMDDGVFVFDRYNNGVMHKLNGQAVCFNGCPWYHAFCGFYGVLWALSACRCEMIFFACFAVCNRYIAPCFGH